MLEEKHDNLQDADGNPELDHQASAESGSTETQPATQLAPEQSENEEIAANLELETSSDMGQTEIAETADAADPVDATIATDLPESASQTFENQPEEETDAAYDELAPVDVDQEVADDETEEIPEPIDVTIAKDAQENTSVLEDLIVNETESPSADIAADNELPNDNKQIEKAIDEPAELVNTVISEEQIAIDAIHDSNAEESEDETLAGRHDIETKDYDTLSMDELVQELEILAAADKVMSVKDHVEGVKHAFLSKYHHFIDEKREEWKHENPDATEDFHYHLPAKSRFDQLYNQYRDKKTKHFQSLQSNLKANLENRLAIVEELKNLINPQENIKDTLKHFNDLRERWKNAGPIPKDKYNHVWNNYHFHVENFYDYLHLDREARDGDFKHNLELKQRIIARAEELVEMADVNKAFRELQDLHRIWKEDIGPVSKEFRESIWNRFSELTKQMHDKREAIFEKMRGTENENLEKKKQIIAKIAELAKEKVGSHSAWLAQIAKVEALRNEFFTTGKVPAEVNEDTWAGFKTAVRDFNALKNSFYKEIKKDQGDNLTRKQALVAKAQELQESDDFAATTPIMKKIQEEWKRVGHVPRKHSDRLWAEFKAACNRYFERMKEARNEENAEEVEAFEKKKAYLETLRDFQLTGEHKPDLDAIKAHIETWKSFGRVPQSRRHIEGKFNKILDVLFEKLSLSKKETDMMRFNNRVESISNDTRKLDNEKIFLMRKIDEVQSEIFQLENNIQFFTSGKNAKKENPMVVEVRKNIEKHKEELATLKAKLKQLRSIGQE